MTMAPPPTNIQIAAYIQQQIQKGVQQGLASRNKKRRTSQKAGGSELLAFDLTSDPKDIEENNLEGFSFEEKDNLPISTTTEENSSL